MADFRFAVRVLLRSPLLTAVVVLSLGLGIGANTAIFSFLHQIVLRSLPVPNPGELVVLNTPGDFKGGRQSSNNAGGMAHLLSYPVFRGLEKQPGALTGVAGFRLFGANLAFRKQTVDGSVMLVSGRYFNVLGVNAARGRVITHEDDVHGAGRPVAVLSNGYWQNKLGGADVLNQPIRINGQPFTIVGITPRGFTGTTFGDQPDVFIPMSFKPAMTPGWDGTDKWNDYWIYSFARLKPGVTRQQAEAALNSAYAGLVEQQAASADMSWMQPDHKARFLKSRLALIEGRHGQSQAREETTPAILILMASTVLVLLIAIANTANVLLARAAQRKKELAVRTALGAGRGRLLRQVLSEAMVLAGAGCVAGILIAYWTVGLLARMTSDGPIPPEDLPTGLEWQVLLFALGVSAVSGLLCGIYPAWEASRSTIAIVLKDQSGQSSATLGAGRMRKTLVCGQVVFSALLLIPTGLFLKSLVNLTRVDLGLNTESVITFGISPELNGYKPAQSRGLFERAEEQLAAIPGVRSVSTALVPLIAGNNWGNGLTVEGYSRDPNADTQSMFNMIGPGFFSKMGVPLINGREFTGRDTLAGSKAAIVNEQFAKHFFGTQDPVGRRFGVGRPQTAKLDIEIVGVVKDTHYSGVKQKPPRLYYTPWRQSDEIGSLTFYVRTALAPEQVMPQVRRVMQSLDPDLPLENMRTFEEQIQRNIRGDRIILQLSAAFSVLATLLAMLGLYGVMAYSVTRRTREIGIRIALGADTRSIRTMVVRELAVILAVGLGVGVPAAVGLSRFAESQMFGVKSFDAFVIAGAAAALIAAAALAGYMPVRRAVKINPTTALRYE